MVNQVPFRQASSLDLDKTTSGIRDTVDWVFDVKTNLLSALWNVTDNVVIWRLLKTATNITDYATHALTPYVNPYIANTSTRLVDTFRHWAFFWDKESRWLAWENIKALSLSIVDPFRDPVRWVWYGLVKNETVDRRANGWYHWTLLEKNIENPYKAINWETDLVKATEQARILKMEDYRKKLADLEWGEAAAA
jgi:hypothetical protein